MLNKEQAEQFARDWVAAWNAHDLDRILAHYDDDFEMASPAVVSLAGEASGVLCGKQAVGAYWSRALDRYPHLHFRLLDVLLGVASVVLVYEGVLGLSVEVFEFGASGKVTRAAAHYDL